MDEYFKTDLEFKIQQKERLAFTPMTDSKFDPKVNQHQTQFKTDTRPKSKKKAKQKLLETAHTELEPSKNGPFHARNIVLGSAFTLCHK